jgi:DHA2 family multidrug resistance protein
MQVLDVAIANVALAHIAGSLSASYDEATWTITSYLIANAIIIPMSGWLADVIGRKRYYMLSVALFTVASVACGLSTNLAWLVIARIFQGIGGGGLAPSEQSMLADTFPPEKRGLAFAAYGVVVIVGPILGPSLGGWITDNLSWHWVFLINLPVGILSLVLVTFLVDEPEAIRKERKALLAKGIRFDAVGMLLVALGLGFLEITLDRGQRDDWFHSSFILIAAAVAVVSLVALIAWELNRKDPVLDLRLLKNRNLMAGCVFLIVAGLVVFGSTQTIPQLLQEVLGYTATDAGLAMTLGGAVTLLMMPISGIVARKVDLRLVIAASLLVEAISFWNMTHLSTGMDFKHAALARTIQLIPLPFLFVPIQSAAYVGLKPSDSNQASALMNVSRNLGGSFGISLVQTLISQREQAHQARMVETLNPLNPIYRQAIQSASRLAESLGRSSADAARMAAAMIYRQVGREASMLAYIDAFHIQMLVILAAIPLVFLMRSAKGGQDHGGGG